MILSIKTLSSDNPFKVVYFDSYGEIISFENRVDKTNDNDYAHFMVDDIMGFLDGSIVSNNYKVMYSKNKVRYSIVKKDNSDIHTILKFDNHISLIEYHSYPEINIYITDSGFDIHATDKLKKFFNNDPDQQQIIKNSKSHTFYVTLKNEPGLLVDTISLDYSKILSGKKQTINYEHKYNEISLYTNFTFDVYSIEDIRNK